MGGCGRSATAKGSPGYCLEGGEEVRWTWARREAVARSRLLL